MVKFKFEKKNYLKQLRISKVSEFSLSNRADPTHYRRCVLISSTCNAGVIPESEWSYELAVPMIID